MYTPGQVVVTTNGGTVVAANADKKIIVHSLAIFKLSSTASNIYLYNGDNALFGNAANPLPMDMIGTAGVAGFILPYNPVGWFQTDAINEAIQVSMSVNVGLVIFVNYDLSGSTAYVPGVGGVVQFSGH